MTTGAGAGSAAALVSRLHARYQDAPDDARTRFGGAEPATALRALAAETSQSLSALLNGVGLALARGFVSGELSYTFSDDLVNQLRSVHDDADGAYQSLFWEVYLAFDAGEYRHRGDSPEADSAERYTRPMLLELLETVSPSG